MTLAGLAREHLHAAESGHWVSGSIRMQQASCVIVALFGAILIGVGVVAVVQPRTAERFFRGFARTAAVHFLEQSVRLLVGVALVTAASRMWHGELFRVLGWLVIITAIGLMILPWRWHRRFASVVIPLVVRHRWPYAILLSLFGGLLVFAVVAGMP